MSGVYQDKNGGGNDQAERPAGHSGREAGNDELV